MQYVRPGASTEEAFLALAPFLRAAEWPKQRLELSRSFDARLARHLDASESPCLPEIHCFYEVLSEAAPHPSLIAATDSMRAAGHPVRVWSYSRDKLDCLGARGVELQPAEDVIPTALYQEIVSATEIRYFSDIFRYAVLLKHGGLWMDTDVILLRPFPFRGDHFFNLQWRPNRRHFICGNVMYAKPRSPHLQRLYETALDCFFSGRRDYGDVGPTLLSDDIASDAGAELRHWVFSPVLFNSIDWSEANLFAGPVSALAPYVNDERVFGIHLWNWMTEGVQCDPQSSLMAMLHHPHARSRVSSALVTGASMTSEGNASTSLSSRDDHRL